MEADGFQDSQTLPSHRGTIYIALAEALDARLVTCDGSLSAAPGHAVRIELIRWENRGPKLAAKPLSETRLRIAPQRATLDITAL